MFICRLTDDAELRLSEERHAEAAAAVVAAHREYLSQWLPWTATATADSIRAYYRLMLEQFARGETLHAVLFVRGELAGAVGFHRIEWLNFATAIGYWLAPPHQGHGLMTRACAALLEHAFMTLRLNRVEIRCAPENARSRAIPLRLGFREEGVAREAQRLGNGYTDLVVYAHLAREWAEIHGRTLPGTSPGASREAFFVQMNPRPGV